MLDFGIFARFMFTGKCKLAQFEPIKYVAHQISNIRMIRNSTDFLNARVGTAQDLFRCGEPMKMCLHKCHTECS